ncbi:hemin uptake protein HemP [Paracoccus sp. MC1862]|uniref:hemin uptake protein HemP n=1 Tax=Paracoccus sp. MC1862 TaxID=2760307 RepID=UPI001600B2B6|nr:hemin uptake protein HemP [Paracoccus sp. MC1862]MBB1499049.1 hemin uptake protein HemP [Paracoccus sp. MC1862]QQO44683.1 hemin uptake protein HemP [Paracoccus sp. MC1862]
MNDLTFHGNDPMPVQVRLQAPLHDATALTAGGHLAQIALADQIYTLRITRAGKLILTK